jgi:hypothetical protein
MLTLHQHKCQHTAVGGDCVLVRLRRCTANTEFAHYGRWRFGFAGHDLFSHYYEGRTWWHRPILSHRRRKVTQERQDLAIA